MSGWLVARNRPPFAAYASPGPSGNSVVAGASVRFDLTDATSKEGSAGDCANSTEESSPGKTTLKTTLKTGRRIDWPFGMRLPRANRDKTVVWSSDTNAWKLFRATCAPALERARRLARSRDSSAQTDQCPAEALRRR